MKTRFTHIGSVLIAFLISLTGIQAQDSECTDYRFYYSNAFAGSSSIYEVLLSDGVAEMTLIEEVPYHAHIAFDKENRLLYVVNGTNGAYQLLDVSIADGSISTPIDLDIDLEGVIAATFNHDNKFLIGAESTDKIYQVNDVLTGSTLEFSDAPVQGGDIAFDGDGQLLLATRAGNGKLFRINTFNPVTLEYPMNIQIGTVPSLVTGIAKTEDGNMLLSANGANEFVVYNSDGSGPIEGQSYETPFTLANGDLAGGCFTQQDAGSGCFATEVLAFEQGLKTNGNPVAENRSNPEAALGQPDAANEAGGFVSLGVDGFIILGFDGAVFDQEGNDIRIFETSFSGDNCGFGDDEFAEVELSDGGDFISIGEICRDGEIDIADAGLGFVTAIKIISSSNTNTPDGYDVDGIEAINGCGPAPEVQGCENFKYYYIADNTPGFPQGTVFEGQIENGDFVLTQLFSAGISSHLAVNNVSNELYVINGSVLRTYNTSGEELNEVAVNGGNFVAAVWNPEDGLVYAAAGNTNNIFKFNPVNGDAELVASDAPVHGGDLIIDEDGNLLLIQRIDNNSSKLHLIENGSATLISEELSNAVNGAALTADGGIIAAEGNNSNSFFIYDISGNDEVELNALLEGQPFPVVDGDMASGCIIELDPDVTDPNCTNETIFMDSDLNSGIVRLTAMGSNLDCDGEYSYRWRIRNETPEPVEVFYNFASDPALQGPFQLDAGEIVIFTSGTGSEPNQGGTMRIFVDGEQVNVKAHGGSISDLAECTPGGCDNGGQFNEAPEWIGQLTAYPNPTSGPTIIEFSSASSGRAILEIADMNGRVVTTLFNQVVTADQSHRIDFNGLSLPNGIYITKLCTEKGIAIDKIMISK
ncbi:MAG: T9SS type A sorting domain-containing protein [Cryomorphaceae bacterium]|nr:T9SS type A sorting domain-containing protein [Flavobacteriales bacterium]